MKKTISIILVLTMVMVFSFSVFADNVIDDNLILPDADLYAGVIPTSDLELNAHLAPSTDNGEYGTLSNPPSSYDLSTNSATSKYFPPIGNQGSFGSCAAFATTYCQFTYESNRLNNTTWTGTNHTASPAWTYNWINEGDSSKGISSSKAYALLKNQGCPSWQEYPYSTSNNIVWPNDDELMYNSLKKTKLNSWSTLSVNTASSSSTHSLTDVKNYLRNGKVLEIETDTNYSIGTSSEYGQIIYRIAKKYNTNNSRIGHAMVIVGYDDNVELDVNGDGQIEASEKGAFKLFNSYGTVYGNAGYIWILYDTINLDTNISGNWEDNFTTDRCRAFSFGSTASWFKFITVVNSVPMLLAKVSLTTADCSDMKITVRRTYLNESLTQQTSTQITGFNQIGGDNSYTRDLIVDFTNLIDDIDTALLNNTWGVQIQDCISNSAGISDISIALVDDLGNEICELTNAQYDNGSFSTIDGTTKIFSSSANILMGDVNYDGQLNASDALQILKFAVDKVEFSNLQQHLGDYNNDGSVNAIDAELILSAAVS